MRASDLIGAHVRDAGGRLLGHVTDVRCALDGPGHGPVPAPRITALVVSPRSVGAALGYQQEGQRGPWLVRVLIRRLHRGQVVIPWSRVGSLGEREIRLRPGRGTDERPEDPS